jgi:hypothetical protein
MWKELTQKFNQPHKVWINMDNVLFVESASSFDLKSGSNIIMNYGQYGKTIQVAESPQDVLADVFAEKTRLLNG